MHKVFTQNDQLNTMYQAATIVQSTSDAIFSTTVDRIILSWNPAAELLLGYSAEEILGQSQTILVPEDRQEEASLAYRRIKKGKQIINLETLRRKKDGTLIPVSITLSTIKDDKKKLIGFSSIYRDISAKKRYEDQLQDSQRLLEGIFLSIKDGMVVIDNNFRVVKYNATVAKWYCLKGNVLGKKCHELFKRSSKPCNSCPYFEAMAKGHPLYRNTTRIMPDGNEYTFETGYFPLTYAGSNGIDGMIISMRNITAQRKMEHEMGRLSNLHLVGEMAASIGHEVRNPMTTVRGFLQVLSDKPEFQDHTDYFSLMISELDRANQIITDFLALARDKKVNIQELDLNSLIETLQPLIAADANNSGHEIKLRLKPIPIVRADKQEITQLVLNVVRNGLEAMPMGGRLTIQTGLRLNRPILTIRDQGAGIPKDILHKLGTPFFTTKDSGTGLGLPVCYSIAERNNAKIEVKTGPKGTAFIVRFSDLVNS